MIVFFFFNDTATPEIYTLPLHDALPISGRSSHRRRRRAARGAPRPARPRPRARAERAGPPRERSDSVRGRFAGRSEEHTSELQSRQYLVCRLLLEKKKKNRKLITQRII